MKDVGSRGRPSRCDLKILERRPIDPRIAGGSSELFVPLQAEVESRHAKAHRVFQATREAGWPWIASTVRLDQSLADARASPSEMGCDWQLLWNKWNSVTRTWATRKGRAWRSFSIRCNWFGPPWFRLFTSVRKNLMSDPWKPRAAIRQVRHRSVMVDFFRTHCRGSRYRRANCGFDARAKDHNQIPDKKRGNVLASTFESSKSETSSFEKKKKKEPRARLSSKHCFPCLMVKSQWRDCWTLLRACVRRFFDVRQPRA